MLKEKTKSLEDELLLQLASQARHAPFTVLFSVGPSETLLGRYDPVTELRPAIDLTEVDLKRSVSRRHARIVNMEGAYSLSEEIGALNGTFVNGTQLTTGQEHPLNDGDEVGLGMVKLQFRT